MEHCIHKIRKIPTKNKYGLQSRHFIWNLKTYSVHTHIFTHIQKFGVWARTSVVVILMHKVRFIALAVNKLSDTLWSSTLPSSIYNHDRVDRACLYASRRHKMHGSLVVLFDHDKPTLLSKTRLLVKKRDLAQHSPDQVLSFLADVTRIMTVNSNTVIVAKLLLWHL